MLSSTKKRKNTFPVSRQQKYQTYNPGSVFFSSLCIVSIHCLHSLLTGEEPVFDFICCLIKSKLQLTMMYLTFNGIINCEDSAAFGHVCILYSGFLNFIQTSEQD
ncbi:hypothetical protein ILYODFUR_028570 [Ilyodon furcidens]|uniref:Uncharacterized protein n=1 Tax=Ilyodon furcidens TaxID=33524 RepID=A0ABV0UW23_9TELE